MRKILVFFLLFSLARTALSQELSLYVVPSPHGVDWKSPRSLLASVVKNRLSFSEAWPGRAFVELKCSTGHELTAMAAEEFDFLKQLLITGRGWGIFYHSFSGHLMPSEQIEKELKLFAEQGRMSFIRFKINAGICQRLEQYLSEFRELNVGRHYGLAHRPLYGEGASAAAFAVSFLKVAGLLDQAITESWTQQVLLPLKHLGLPLTDQYVNFLKLPLNGQWAQASEPHQVLIFWDPDRMHRWITEQTLRGESAQWSLLQIGNAKGVMLDKSHYPVPPEPYWRGD
jgi:hypothetical protein